MTLWTPYVHASPGDKILKSVEAGEVESKVGIKQGIRTMKRLSLLGKRVFNELPTVSLVFVFCPTTFCCHSESV